MTTKTTRQSATSVEPKKRKRTPKLELAQQQQAKLDAAKERATVRAQARKKATGVDPVTAYARRVTSGELIAGPDIRNACARHLRDLLTGHLRGLHFDVDAAMLKIEFFPDVLKLNGGEFEGKAFHLLDWQQFIVGSLYGWKGEDGWRRFRSAYVETGKGSGK